MKVIKIQGRHSHSGQRNSMLFAIAPNANSSILMGCSPSIEPWASNAITHRTRAGTHFVQNAHLDAILRERDPENIDKHWSHIINNKGSVQNLDILTNLEREVFKSAMEIDQYWVVKHAADRQKYICQGQSVNLFFPHGSSAKYVSEIHMEAWKLGLKGLYYFRTEKATKGDSVGTRIERQALGDAYPVTLKQPEEDEDDTCLACQG